MRSRTAAALAALAACAGAGAIVLHAQGRGGSEWTTSGYDAQHTGSIRTDPRISVATMQKPGEFGAFKFLWKLKLEHDPDVPGALTEPILLDRLIGFRGFKSIAFVGTQSQMVHAIDTDFGVPLWKYQINYSASPPPVVGLSRECSGGMTAAASRPTAVATSAFGGRGGGGRGAASGGGVGEPGKGALTLATAGRARGGAAAPPAGRGAGAAADAGAAGAAARGAVPGSAAAAAGAVPGGLPPGARAGGGGGGRGRGFSPGDDAAYVVGSDGYLHALNVQNGWENMTPALFLPANTRAAGLIVATMSEQPAVAYAVTTHGCGSQPDGVWAMDLGSAEKEVTAFQPEGAFIAGSQGATLGRDGTLYVATRDGTSAMSSSVIALEPKTLKVKGRVKVPDARFTSTPLVFQANDKDVIAVAGGGRVFLFDSAALGSGPLATSAAAGAGEYDAGALASWQDAQGARWLALPTDAGITALKVVDQGGKLALQSGWTRAIASPLPPLVVNGVLFAASAGTRAAPAVLYAIEADTGKDLWNSGKTMTSMASGGLAAGGGNVYVPGADSTLYAFGFEIEK